MTLGTLEVTGYRSLHEVSVDFGSLTVVTGPNGSGKSNLYRALRLVRACGTGEVARRIAAEGGMPSVTWAGRRRGEPKVELAVTLDELRYEIRLATAGRGSADAPVTFPLDPIVTSERILAPGTPGRPVEMLDRAGSTAFVRDDEGRRVAMPAAFRESETVISQLIDPGRYPELVAVREALARMRFHHQLRTDEAAPARQPALGTRTLAVADDGSDLAAALLTIASEGDGLALENCLATAFDGSRMVIHEDDAGRLELRLDTGASLCRPLLPGELSDGQLRYCFLAATLLSPRPPDVIVLNEPESSLHVGLLAPLAGMVTVAAERAQVVVTTHSRELVDLLSRRGRAEILTLELV
ncbi:MAG: AAA family ATPase, partial [Acidimicrobiales bacterium]